MEKSFSESYKAAGVDITAGYKAVELMKEHVAKTMMFGNVPSDIGGFGGLFELDIKNIKEPVLVSGTDGVGTKLKMAFLMDKHDTVGTTAWPCASTTSSASVPSLCSSSTTSRWARTIRKSRHDCKRCCGGPHPV